MILQIDFFSGLSVLVMFYFPFLQAHEVKLYNACCCDNHKLPMGNEIEQLPP